MWKSTESDPNDRPLRVLKGINDKVVNEMDAMRGLWILTEYSKEK